MSRVTYLVLDEADRMLAEGFSGEVEQILCDVRPDRQVALFSATWPASVQELAKAVMPKNASSSYGPVRIRVGAAVQASEEGALQAREGITQEVVVIDYPSSDWQKAEEEKSRLMEKHVRNVLTTVSDSKVLVFVNTKVQADSLTTKLWKEGFQADSMHGGRPQETRLSVLRRFREGELRLLVVTDVFARGLDIPQVSHVVIYEMGETEDYIHRIGRTGRGVGGTGHALVFF
jgi:superfamily II DNA/RNA helicase